MGKGYRFSSSDYKLESTITDIHDYRCRKDVVMKILIVQLSDMHCTKDDITLTSKIRKAVRALRVIGKVDGALLVFSGDIADKGTHEEYQVAR